VTNTPKDGIFYRQGLGAEELAEAREMGTMCEARDGIDLRVSWEALAEGVAEPAHSFLAYRDGVLAGFLMLYGIGEPEAEGTGVVKPEYRRQGIFGELVDAAKDAGREQGTATLILYVDRRSTAAPACMGALGAEHTFSETNMRLPEASVNLAGAAELLDFRVAAPEDAAVIGAILAEDMEGDTRDLGHVIMRNMQNPAYRYYVATLDGDPVGTLNIQTIDGDKYIYGFVVRPAYRRRGYGREILACLLRELAAERPQPVYLEVETENTPAVNLYRSLGFEELVTYDYYRLKEMP
jgi:ribosomal protein S18 acetylase RimI-like enzyme